MRRFVLCLALILLSPSLAQAVIHTEEITYYSDGVALKGYLAFDERIKGPRPGVLVVHEWWGHNDYARTRARMLAALGYTALALDMYGDGKLADHPEDAGKFSGAVMQNIKEVGLSRFLAALDLLKRHQTVDPNRIAAIGYCFGGGIVLHMARLGVDLKGVVSFHGSLKTAMPAEKGKVKAKVLVCHGADDNFIPEEDISLFKEEMEKAEVDFRFKSYQGAVHSFTNPAADTVSQKFGINIGYNFAADKQSWQDMKEFFSEIFK